MKKLISYTLALLCAFSMAGCQNQPKPQEEVKTTVLPTTATVSSNTDPSTTDLSATEPSDTVSRSPHDGVPCQHCRVICAKESRCSSSGQVLKVFEDSYDAENNSIISKYYADGELQTTTEKQYDRNGNLIRQVEDWKGRISKTLWQYDENGNEIQEIQYDDTGFIRSMATCEYDRNGNCIRRIFDDALRNRTTTSVYEYDDCGNHVKTIHYDPDGNIEETDEYEYDKNGNWLSSTTYDADGSQRYKLTWTYNEDGHCLDSTSYDGDGTIRSKTKYEYDEQGNQISYSNYEDRELVDQCKYVYNEKGNIIQASRYYEEGVLSYTQKMEYDENGNKIRQAEYDSTGELGMIIEYEGYQTVCLASYEPSDSSPTVSQAENHEDLSPYTPLICTKATWYDANGEITEMIKDAHNEENTVLICQYLSPYGTESTSITKKTYDQNGNLIRKVYNDDGETSTTLWEYDENGNEIHCIEYAPGGTIKSHSTRDYDQNGNLTLYICYDSDGNVSDRVERTYDANGNLIKRIAYNADGVVSERTGQYTYDANGKECNHISIRYDIDGNLDYTVKDEYDEHGNEIKSVFYHPDGSENFRVEYEYDARGNEISCHDYDDGQRLCRYTRQYDDNDRIILYTSYSIHGELEYTEKIEYDEDGNMVSSKRYAPSGKLIQRIEYTRYQTTYLDFFAG